MAARHGRAALYLIIRRLQLCGVTKDPYKAIIQLGAGNVSGFEDDLVAVFNALHQRSLLPPAADLWMDLICQPLNHVASPDKPSKTSDLLGDKIFKRNMNAAHEIIELLLDEKRGDPNPESGSAASGMVFENSADEDKMDRFKDRIIEQDDASDAYTARELLDEIACAGELQIRRASDWPASAEPRFLAVMREAFGCDEILVRLSEISWLNPKSFCTSTFSRRDSSGVLVDGTTF